MNKLLKPGRSAIDLRASDAPRPSRIRRDPPGRVPDRPERADPTDREQWIVALGVILFALAFAIIILGISDYTSK